MQERPASPDLSLPPVERPVGVLVAAADALHRSAAAACVDPEEIELGEPAALATLSLECSACGYGIARSAPPKHCPMCHSEDAWLYTSWRPFSRPPDGVFV
jgi:hypothetical protein